jgi:HPt (histidine-containing phosphotransfer) domain-containing protein
MDMTKRRKSDSELIEEVEKSLRRLGPKYLRDKWDEFKNLKKSDDLLDFQRLQEFGHKLKGSAGNYGFNQLGKLASLLELYCQRHDFQKVGQVAKKIEAFLKEKSSPEVEVKSEKKEDPVP